MWGLLVRSFIPFCCHIFFLISFLLSASSKQLLLKGKMLYKLSCKSRLTEKHHGIVMLRSLYIGQKKWYNEIKVGSTINLYFQFKIMLFRITKSSRKVNILIESRKNYVQQGHLMCYRTPQAVNCLNILYIYVKRTSQSTIQSLYLHQEDRLGN